MNLFKAAVAAVTAGLTGCMISSGPVYHVDDPFQFLAHAAGRGIIPIMVVGNPYPERRDQVEAAIAHAFDRNFESLGNPFRIVDPAAGEGIKIVVIFDAPDPLAQAVCKDPTRFVSAPKRTRTSVAAFFCGDGPYSQYSMSFATVQSPKHPRFAEMMNQMAYYTVPREPNPDRR